MKGCLLSSACSSHRFSPIFTLVPVFVFPSTAVSASIALLVFPIAVHHDSSIKAHRYGIGYGLGWAGAFFFLAAAVCMSLDDLVRESSRAKCCRWCWRGKHSDRNDLRQV